jgi:hypothetical protein
MIGYRCYRAPGSKPTSDDTDADMETGTGGVVKSGSDSLPVDCHTCACCSVRRLSTRSVSDMGLAASRRRVATSRSCRTSEHTRTCTRRRAKGAGAGPGGKRGLTYEHQLPAYASRSGLGYPGLWQLVACLGCSPYTHTTHLVLDFMPEPLLALLQLQLPGALRLLPRPHLGSQARGVGLRSGSRRPSRNRQDHTSKVRMHMGGRLGNPRARRPLGATLRGSILCGLNSCAEVSKYLRGSRRRVGARPCAESATTAANRGGEGSEGNQRSREPRTGAAR